jgi:Protein of unknown function
MSTEPEQTLDGLLLEAASSQWLKVARVIGDVKGKSDNLGLSSSIEEIAERLAKLVAAGQLESAGNISNSRFSEVRLPGGSDNVAE